MMRKKYLASSFLYEEIIKQVYKMKVTEIQAVGGRLGKILTSQVLQRMPGLWNLTPLAPKWDQYGSRGCMHSSLPSPWRNLTAP